jgi:hypothetical protein
MRSIGGLGCDGLMRRSMDEQVIAYKDCAICGSIPVLIPYFLLTGM